MGLDFIWAWDLIAFGPLTKSHLDKITFCFVSQSLFGAGLNPIWVLVCLHANRPTLVCVGVRMYVFPCVPTCVFVCVYLFVCTSMFACLGFCVWAFKCVYVSESMSMSPESKLVYVYRDSVYQTFKEFSMFQKEYKICRSETACFSLSLNEP